MQQFVVKKSSRVGEEVWTTRVLTVDEEHHILYLSKRSDASQMDHHCMVSIREVEVFPAYSSTFHTAAYLPSGSWRAISIRGSTITLGDSSPLHRLLQIGTRKMTPMEHSSLKASRQKLLGGEEPLDSESLVKSTVVSNEEWMLQCMTKKDLRNLLKSLCAAVADPSCMKGPKLRLH
ncbi:hypothetical protein GH5_01594 [Leishmania sp. Ghana 2012 LV757]|uniref:hypothetical protein n=1 Tax=Leishmania sp. Ghana 2012 LV757 TaxID=2803181 RepID=UPI001B3E59F5|nr:hypothetical protein GH5_01594 [Leishmania sp. Ghana 2012 LV757]